MKKIFLTFLAMVAMVGMVNAQRAWAYDLALAQEAEAYTFTFKATTAANATLIFTDVEGTELAAVELGAVEAGLNTKTLAASELPQGKKVNWAVKMAGEAIVTGETLLEVTDQTRGIYDFYNMMDVLVDNNPESEYFSRIYIQMAFDGATDGATDRADTQTSGFFIYDQELNELNPTTNVGIKPTLPEGYNMGDNRNKFHRLDIDPKTGFLTWCYNMDAQPAVFAVDPANLAGDATNIVAGVTGLTRTAAHCYDEEGTLYIMDIADSKGAIYKIVDGQAVQLTEPTGKWVNASIALAADGKGGLWVAHNRGQMDTYYQLVHVTAAGELDYTVWADNTNGFEGGCLRGALAYVVERQILAQGRNGAVELYNVAYDAETGVPTLTKFAVTPTVGNNIDGLHFDYAGDLYVVNSSKEKFQKFVVPTDNNVCVVPAAAKHAFEIEAAPAVVEDTITNLVFDYESTAFIGGPSEAYQVEVFLVLGEDKLNGTWTLSEETAIAVDGEDAIFIEGTVSNIDLGIPAADAVIVAEVGGQLYEFHLNMIGGAPEDAIVIEVVDANIKVNKSLLFSDPIMGDMYDYSLTITADWTYAEDGLTYPILVEVPVYYPEATEPSDIPCAVTVGNIAGNWLGFAEGELTITTAEGVVTVKGIVANSGTGVAFDLTISGKLPVESAVDNVVVDGNIVKTFENGQLVIIKNGVKVNASGAVVK